MKDLVLDYLRRSIIPVLLSAKKKQQIVRLVDDSLVSGDEEEL